MIEIHEAKEADAAGLQGTEKAAPRADRRPG